MKYTIIFSFMVLSMLLLTIEESKAQCVACYQNADGSCRTELVNRDGSNGCGCDSGCSCDGQCQYVEPNEHKEIGLLWMNLDYINSLELNDNGILIKPENINVDELSANFQKGGRIGDVKMENVWFGEDRGIYLTNANELLLFPLKNDDEFDLIDCNGKSIATVKL
jgi:hypothetical protein